MLMFYDFIIFFLFIKFLISCCCGSYLWQQPHLLLFHKFLLLSSYLSSITPALSLSSSLPLWLYTLFFLSLSSYILTSINSLLPLSYSFRIPYYYSLSFTYSLSLFLSLLLSSLFHSFSLLLISSLLSLSSSVLTSLHFVYFSSISLALSPPHSLSSVSLTPGSLSSHHMIYEMSLST